MRWTALKRLNSANGRDFNLQIRSVNRFLALSLCGICDQKKKWPFRYSGLLEGRCHREGVASGVLEPGCVHECQTDTPEEVRLSPEHPGELLALPGQCCHGDHGPLSTSRHSFSWWGGQCVTLFTAAEGGNKRFGIGHP